jgi:hypothetical protein
VVATDIHGNASRPCTFEVVVNDNERPVVTCPVPATSYSNDPGKCTAKLSFAATATDNCGVSSYAYSVGGNAISFPYEFAVGTTMVTAVATDVHGNTSVSCSFNVVVVDNENPTITCPGNITAIPTSVNGAVVNYTIVSADNCPGSTVAMVSGLASGATFPIGVTTNTYKVTDVKGNSATCSFTVTVRDPYCDRNPNNQKVYVCHNGNTICISVNALATHLGHNDQLGKCEWYTTAARIGAPAQVKLVEGALNIYPNPTRGLFDVQLTNIEPSKGTIVITNSNGSVIERRSIEVTAKRQTQLVSFDLNKYASGLYYIQLITPGGVKTDKVLIQR